MSRPRSAYRPWISFLPALRDRLRLRDIAQTVAIPHSKDELDLFVDAIELVRSTSALGVLPLRGSAGIVLPSGRANLPGHPGTPLPQESQHLRLLGLARWQLVTASLFLDEACALPVRTSQSRGDPLVLSIVATLIAFPGGLSNSSITRLSAKAWTPTAIVDRVVDEAPVRPRPMARRVSLAEAALASAPDWHRALPPLSSSYPGILRHQLSGHELRNLIFYLLGPDPLEMLVRRVLGIPDSIEFDPPRSSMRRATPGRSATPRSCTAR